jgi:hypothetical protein
MNIAAALCQCGSEKRQIRKNRHVRSAPAGSGGDHYRRALAIESCCVLQPSFSMKNAGHQGTDFHITNY